MRKRTAIPLTLVGVAAILSACAPTSGESTPPTAQESTSQQAEPNRLPTADTLGTDLGDPDSVAEDFVTIIETHDAASDHSEWASQQRATALMSKHLAEANFGAEQTLGGDWEDWVAADAFIRPTVAFTDDAAPADTDKTAYRTVRARLSVSSTHTGPDGKPINLQTRERIHRLTLTNSNGSWQVKVWQPGGLEDNHAPQAGEESEAHHE